MVRLLRYICGYVPVEVRGKERARFLNQAVKLRMNFWDYRAEGESYSFKVNLFREKELLAIARKTGVSLSFGERRGLPLRLAFLLKHPGLIVGLVLALWTVSCLSDNIWVLRTSGSEVYSEEEIFSAAKELGVFTGADYDDFDAISAGRMMMLKLPEISWVSINNDGVVTDILIKDREKPPEMEENPTGIWNVVASRPGVIFRVEAKEGLPLVKEGDVVQAGDLCITGIWENKYGYTLTAPSFGNVYAQVQENFSVTVPDRRTVYQEIETVTKQHLEVFGLRIPLSFTHAGFELSSSESRKSSLKLLGMELPISLVTTKITRLQENVEFLPENEMEGLALEELERKQAEFPGELLWQENKISFGEGGCTIKSRSFFLMDIGVRQEVLVNERILAD